MAPEIFATSSRTVRRHLVGEVEGLPGQFGALGQGLGQPHVGRRAVLDVEVVPDEAAVGPDHGPFARGAANGWCRGRCGSS